jgi:hypothetical protein
MIADSPEISSTNQKETHIPSPIIMEEDLTGKKGVQKLLEGHSFSESGQKTFSGYG